MPLSVDNVSSMNGDGAGVGPFTWLHTCTGSNRVLWVQVSFYDGTSVVTGVTYNGVAMTAVPSGSVRNGLCFVAMYSLIAPATGSNTISVSVSEGVFDFAGGAVSFVDAHQVSPLGTAATASGNSTAPSVNVTSATGEIVVDAVTIVYNGTLTVGASQTQRWNGIASVGYIKYGGSTESGATTTTMSWTNGTAQDWAIAGVAVKPAGGGSFQAAWARGAIVTIGAA